MFCDWFLIIKTWCTLTKNVISELCIHVQLLTILAVEMAGILHSVYSRVLLQQFELSFSCHFSQHLSIDCGHNVHIYHYMSN